jgi:hypothetical protein
VDRVGIVKERLDHVAATLVGTRHDLERGDGEDPQPSVWAPAVDGLHAAVAELARLGAALQGRLDRWERAHPEADPRVVAGVVEAAEALGDAADALAEAATSAANGREILARASTGG